ncbi:hypothetical protein [Streptomyces sp. NPDC058486]|uniref:hypothetical protein n=1 Tax=unclassified Streptomyces TaxID=2593676 RepID=UPI00365A3ECF
MSSPRTTPPRPVDVAAVFPRLEPLARPALRLHPRRGKPTPYDSSVGGPLLWPRAQPWPHCDKWHDGPPNPLVPVAQLYARDIPFLRNATRLDLLQVLWCPCEHAPDFKPATELVWRAAADVTDVLAAPPEPYDVEYEQYLPKPCVLAPEPITEYPNLLELDEETRAQLGDLGRWRAGGVAMDGYEEDPESYYGDALSDAPGWKVGGWAPWGLTDPIARFCVACGAAMLPLLTVPSTEWWADEESWVPVEDRGPDGRVDEEVRDPTGVQVSRGNNLQIYGCPNEPWHPHTTLIQ